jgi:hypothetical protein
MGGADAQAAAARDGVTLLSIDLLIVNRYIYD